MRMYQCLYTGPLNIQLHIDILTYFIKIGQTNYKSLKIKILLINNSYIYYKFAKEQIKKGLLFPNSIKCKIVIVHKKYTSIIGESQ